MIYFRTVLEVLGKPQEHVETSLKSYVEQIKQDKRYKLVHSEFAEIKKQEEAELWTMFAELEIKTEKLEHLTSFCFDYMPSIIEIIEPAEMSISEAHLATFFNDLQARLHQVDMVAKQLRLENDIFKRNVASLLNNYVRVLLSKGSLTADQLSKLTGVTKDQLEDFLDAMIDQQKIDLKKGVYSLKEKVADV